MSRKYVLILSFLIVSIVFFSASRANFYFNMGNHFFGGGAYDLAKAEKYYDKVVQINPELPRLNYQMARLEFIRGDFFSAISHINKEIELFPEYKRSHYVRGLVYGFKGNYDLAISDFKEFLIWKPESWAGHNDLAWLYFQKGDIKAVESQARLGLEYNPNNPWLENIYGVALLNLERKEESRLALKSSLENFERIGPKEWGGAYPGNDPRIYKKGYEETLKAIRENLSLAE